MADFGPRAGLAYNPRLDEQTRQAEMSIDQLEQIARAMVAPGKGIIAIDESNTTIKKRFDAVGIDCTEENRRFYREMLLTTPQLSDHISGAILYDETLRQSSRAGVPFAKIMMDNGILPGIKVDKGPVPLAGFPGEVVTEGLDGLRQRLEEYAKLGAKFAKWRAVIAIGEDMPSSTCIDAPKPSVPDMRPIFVRPRFFISSNIFWQAMRSVCGVLKVNFFTGWIISIAPAKEMNGTSASSATARIDMEVPVVVPPMMAYWRKWVICPQ